MTWQTRSIGLTLTGSSRSYGTATLPNSPSSSATGGALLPARACRIPANGLVEIRQMGQIGTSVPRVGPTSMSGTAGTLGVRAAAGSRSHRHRPRLVRG